MRFDRISKEEFFNMLEESKEGKCYRELVKKAPKRRVSKGLEKHHVYPRGLGGKDGDGLVYLTAFEHILAHYLLALITDHSTMYKAIRILSGSQLQKVSDLEKVTVENLEHWAELRDKAFQVPLTEVGRKKISEKAYERWQSFRESGRIEEVKKNISEKTKEGMNNAETLTKVRANLGSKWYYSEKLNKTMHWHPWMPLPDPDLWRPGRAPMREESKKKLSSFQQKAQRVYYHNDELKINKRFGPQDTIPEGFVLGQKIGYKGNLKASLKIARDEHYRKVGASNEQVFEYKQNLDEK